RRPTGPARTRRATRAGRTMPRTVVTAPAAKARQQGDEVARAYRRVEQGPYLRIPAFIAGYARTAPAALANPADLASIPPPPPISLRSIAHGARGCHGRCNPRRVTRVVGPSTRTAAQPIPRTRRTGPSVAAIRPRAMRGSAS